MKFKSLIYSKKLAVGMVGFLLSGMISYVAYSHLRQNHPSQHGNPINWQKSGPIKVKTGLSQYKVIQNQNGEITMQIDIEAEKNSEIKLNRKPTDYVVVLDRSGSMASENKINYAHEAIHSLIRQLGSDDRFALVAFDSSIEVPISLQKISPDSHSIWFSKVAQLHARGSTFLSGGLERGIEILKNTDSNRAKRIILLSDGEATDGITDIASLNQISNKASDKDIVVSTIGLGLDFNEELMANLADHGRGNYHYLEKLNALEKVLAQEFYSASQILAKNLNLNLDLNPSITIKDASGYPLKRTSKGYQVNAGHLYYGQNKTFFVTLKVPTNQLKSYQFGTGNLSYNFEDKVVGIKLDTKDWKLGVVAPEKRNEVIASINKKIFNDSWVDNNLGSLFRSNAKLIKKGRKDEALGFISEYKKKLNYANSLAPSDELRNQIADLDQMEEDVAEAFSGPNQGQKTKRLSKGYQKNSYDKQRKIK